MANLLLDYPGVLALIVWMIGLVIWLVRRIRQLEQFQQEMKAEHDRIHATCCVRALAESTPLPEVVQPVVAQEPASLPVARARSKRR